MSKTSMTGPIVMGGTPTPTSSQIVPLELGSANTIMSGFNKLTTGIADSVATTLATLTVPNQAQSALVRISVRTAISNSSHTYDSTRVQSLLIAVTRVAGAASVAVLSSAIGAQIATSSGGQTITSTVGLGSVTGANTATQTIAIQVTNVNGSAGTTEAQIWVDIMNSQSNGVTVA